ncbi:DUF6270 domain-containing protein [Brevibacterium daeguense]|uniref:DUF6270 domain-containing protein n=1 Tax=Brevibacterium daeguense TaxID=909936 RepID=A0ABP8EHN4_9MICO|nr:DUF6270 domain-containing protein [Brevibacterium daeguense]
MSADVTQKAECTNTQRIAIFGSCVSRDTCEYISGPIVEAYVARQSAIVSLQPVGEATFSSDSLDSPFQAKMYEGDQRGDAVQRLIGAEPDVILIDLVDERRGVWQFPDGSFLTNSVEASRTGMESRAPELGARLIEFGTDEHFSLWSRAFDSQVQELADAGLLATSVLLDIEWAAALSGHPYPSTSLRSTLGRRVRRGQRRARNSVRRLQQGAGLAQSLKAAQEISETQAESFARRAFEANERLQRYTGHAHRRLGTRVRRESSALRIDPEHKWGPEPYHYRGQDYVSIAAEICAIASRRHEDS